MPTKDPEATPQFDEEPENKAEETATPEPDDDGKVASLTPPIEPDPPVVESKTKNDKAKANKKPEEPSVSLVEGTDDEEEAVVAESLPPIKFVVIDGVNHTIASCKKNGLVRNCSMIDGEFVIDGKEGHPIFVGDPFIGYENDPVRTVKGTPVRFWAKDPETRCHVYVEVLS